jgi:hypothetical protein
MTRPETPTRTSTGSAVRRDEDSLLERLELLEQLDPLLLREATVNRDRRELALEPGEAAASTFRAEESCSLRGLQENACS